jgi:hypothetical protein
VTAIAFVRARHLLLQLRVVFAAGLFVSNLLLLFLLVFEISEN